MHVTNAIIYIVHFLSLL